MAQHDVANDDATNDLLTVASDGLLPVFDAIMQRSAGSACKAWVIRYVVSSLITPCDSQCQPLKLCADKELCSMTGSRAGTGDCKEFWMFEREILTAKFNQDEMPFEVRIALESTMGKLTDRDAAFYWDFIKASFRFFRKATDAAHGDGELENAFCPQEEALNIDRDGRVIAISGDSEYGILIANPNIQTPHCVGITNATWENLQGGDGPCSLTVAEKEIARQSAGSEPLSDAAQLADFTAAFDDSALTAKWLCVAIMMSFIALMCVYAYFTKSERQKDDDFVAHIDASRISGSASEILPIDAWSAKRQALFCAFLVVGTLAMCLILGITLPNEMCSNACEGREPKYLPGQRHKCVRDSPCAVVGLVIPFIVVWGAYLSLSHILEMRDGVCQMRPSLLLSEASTRQISLRSTCWALRWLWRTVKSPSQWAEFEKLYSAYVGIEMGKYFWWRVILMEVVEFSIQVYSIIVSGPFLSTGAVMTNGFALAFGIVCNASLIFATTFCLQEASSRELVVIVDWLVDLVFFLANAIVANSRDWVEASVAPGGLLLAMLAIIYPAVSLLLVPSELCSAIAVRMRPPLEVKSRRNIGHPSMAKKYTRRRRSVILGYAKSEDRSEVQQKRTKAMNKSSIFALVFLATGLALSVSIVLRASIKQSKCSTIFGNALWAGAEPASVFPDGILSPTRCAWEHVEIVKARGAGMKSLPVDVMMLLDSVQFMDVTGNNIRRIPLPLMDPAQSPFLRKGDIDIRLDLAGNPVYERLRLGATLRVIPLEFLTRFLPSLTLLNGSGTAIEHVPAELTQLSKLTALDFADSALTKIHPSVLKLLPNIRSIRLEGSPAGVSLDWSFYDIYDEYLFRLLELSPPTLKSLNLAGNKKITEIPLQISRLQHLTALNFSYTGVGVLPLWLAEKLPRLVALDLRGCQMESRTFGNDAVRMLNEIRERSESGSEEIHFLLPNPSIWLAWDVSIVGTPRWLLKQIIQSTVSITVTRKLGVGNAPARKFLAGEFCQAKNLRILNLVNSDIKGGLSSEDWSLHSKSWLRQNCPLLNSDKIQSIYFAYAGIPLDISIFSGAKQLQELRLYGNLVTATMQSLTMLTSLRHFSLGVSTPHNRSIINVTSSIIRLQQLTSLTLGVTAPGLIPREITQLENLQEFSFSMRGRNGLRATPSMQVQMYEFFIRAGKKFGVYDGSSGIRIFDLPLLESEWNTCRWQTSFSGLCIDTSRYHPPELKRSQANAHILSQGGGRRGIPKARRKDRMHGAVKNSKSRPSTRDGSGRVVTGKLNENSSNMNKNKSSARKLKMGMKSKTRATSHASKAEVLTWHGSGRREDVNGPRDVILCPSAGTLSRTSRPGSGQSTTFSVLFSDTENSRIVQAWNIPRHGGTALDSEDNVDGRVCRTVGNEMQLLHPTGLCAVGMSTVSGMRQSGCIVLICDSGHNRIKALWLPHKEVDLDSGAMAGKGQGCKLVNVAGSGICGFSDGDGKTAEFDRPSSICIASDGSIIVADFNNHRIRRIYASAESPRGQLNDDSEWALRNDYRWRARAK
eukprot:g2.t1